MADDIIRKSRAEIAAEERSQLMHGWTLHEIAMMMGKSLVTVQKRVIGKVKQSGMRGVKPVYRLPDVMPLLVEPSPESIERAMKSGRVADVSPQFSKDYWAGLRSRQSFMLQDGDLWRTNRVVETVSRYNKLVRDFLVLLPDELERRASLTKHQRDELQVSLDDALRRLRELVIKAFDGNDPDGLPGSLEPPDEHDDDDDFLTLPPDGA